MLANASRRTPRRTVHGGVTSEITTCIKENNSIIWEHTKCDATYKMSLNDNSSSQLVYMQTATQVSKGSYHLRLMTILCGPNLLEIEQELSGKKAPGVPQLSVLTDDAPLDTSEGTLPPLGKNQTLMKELVRSIANLRVHEKNARLNIFRHSTLTNRHHSYSVKVHSYYLL